VPRHRASSFARSTTRSAHIVRLLLGALAIVALAACKVDATVDITIGPDGTGSVTVTAVADAEVVQQAPGLAGDLHFDDAKAAGWTVDGPTATPDGGLRVVLTHPVTSAADATNVLNSLGPPFVGMNLDRVVTDGGDGATTTLTGQLALTGGFDAFADADLLGAVGGSPYAAQITASGATPATALSVTLRATVAGTVEDTNGREEQAARVWTAPLDGSAADVRLVARQSPSGGGFWSIASTVLLVLLVLWLAAATVFIVSVVRARARRAQRRRRALSRLR
jgi:hypothetical protein